MVRANAGCDGKLEVLGLGEALCGQVTGVEAVSRAHIVRMGVLSQSLSRRRQHTVW